MYAEAKRAFLQAMATADLVSTAEASGAATTARIQAIRSRRNLALVAYGEGHYEEGEAFAEQHLNARRVAVYLQPAPAREESRRETALLTGIQRSALAYPVGVSGAAVVARCG
jgi:hypothetical protein